MSGLRLMKGHSKLARMIKSGQNDSGHGQSKRAGDRVAGTLLPSHFGCTKEDGKRVLTFAPMGGRWTFCKDTLGGEAVSKLTQKAPV
jgi:hypothetical protein